MAVTLRSLCLLEKTKFFLWNCVTRDNDLGWGTDTTADKINNHLEENVLELKEQKGCHRNNSGKKRQPFTNKSVKKLKMKEKRLLVLAEKKFHLAKYSKKKRLQLLRYFGSWCLNSDRTIVKFPVEKIVRTCLKVYFYFVSFAIYWL